MTYQKVKKLLFVLSKTKHTTNIGADGMLEIWKKNTDKEVARRLLKTQRRKIEKQKDTDEKTKEEAKNALKEYKTQVMEQVLRGEYDVKYIFTPLANQQLGNKARSFYFWKKSRQGTEDFRAIIGFNNNSLELWGLKVIPKKQEDVLSKHPLEKGSLEATMQKMQEIGWWGHKSPIRVCAVSGNDQLLLTASTGISPRFHHDRIGQDLERRFFYLYQECRARKCGVWGFPAGRQVRGPRNQGGLPIHCGHEFAGSGTEN